MDGKGFDLDQCAPLAFPSHVTCIPFHWAWNADVIIPVSSKEFHMHAAWRIKVGKTFCPKLTHPATSDIKAQKGVMLTFSAYQIGEDSMGNPCQPICREVKQQTSIAWDVHLPSCFCLPPNFWNLLPITWAQFWSESRTKRTTTDAWEKSSFLPPTHPPALGTAFVDEEDNHRCSSTTMRASFLDTAKSRREIKALLRINNAPWIESIILDVLPFISFSKIQDNTDTAHNNQVTLFTTATMPRQWHEKDGYSNYA